MEASLTCAVCLSLFEEPVTLPVCSHNFCRPCVAECLSQSQATRSAAAAAAPAPPPPSSSRPAPPSRPSDQPAELRQSPGRASRNGGSALSVSCPLCRKQCPLPRDGGAAALPVNTTLAEVVKLFKAAANAAKSGQELTGEEASASLAPRLAVLGASCEKHPGRSLELYCRMCRRGGCGQCVSEEHRGIFHFVNLIDVVYQEEKLAFFSNLKKLRELQLQLMEETEIYSDIEAIMQNEEGTIKTQFEKVYKALEARKKQLLEDLESQKKRKIKECLIWKRMKDVHRKTVENILSDCEQLLDECDPHHFLEVACNLNQRMKTQLDLMQIASCNKNQTEYKHREMDTTSVMNDILALHLSEENLDAIKDSPFGDSEDKKSLQNMFCPMTGEVTLDNNNIPVRYMSVTAATESQSMSHEELRYNYYTKHQMCSGGLQKRASSVKGRYILQPKFQYLKSKTSAVALNETKNQEKVKKQTLLKQGDTETNLPNSFAFTFEGQGMRFDVPDSRNNGSMKEGSFLEKCYSFSKTTEVPPVHEVIFPSDTQLSSTMSSDSSQSATPSVGPSNLSTSVPVQEYMASPFTTSKECFKKENLGSSGLSLEKSKDSNISSIIGHNYSNSAVFSPSNIFAAAATTTTTISNSVLGAAVCEKPFSAFSPVSHNSSEQNFCPFFLPVQKTGQESTPVSFNKEDILECNWLVPSTLTSGKPVIGESDFVNNLVCQTSSSASDKIDSSKKQPENLSSNSSSVPHLFAFKGSQK